MNVAVCVSGAPIRMVLLSPAASVETKVAVLRLPMSMLLLPVVRLEPPPLPNPMLLPPVVLLSSAAKPFAVLSLPVVLLLSAATPLAVLS